MTKRKWRRIRGKIIEKNRWFKGLRAVGYDAGFAWDMFNVAYSYYYYGEIKEFTGYN